MSLLSLCNLAYRIAYYNVGGDHLVMTGEARLAQPASSLVDWLDGDDDYTVDDTPSTFLMNGDQIHDLCRRRSLLRRAITRQPDRPGAETWRSPGQPADWLADYHCVSRAYISRRRLPLARRRG